MALPVFFSWITEFREGPSLDFLSECYAREAWPPGGREEALPELVRSLVSEFCEVHCEGLSRSSAPSFPPSSDFEEWRQRVTEILERLAQESMLALRGEWHGSEFTSSEFSGLSELPLFHSKRAIRDTQGAAEGSSEVAPLFALADALTSYRLLLYAIACYRSGHTEKAQRLQDQLANQGPQSLRWALLAERSGYLLNHGHFGSCLSMLASGFAEGYAHSRSRSIPLWEFYRLQSVAVIAAQAMGRFLEARAEWKKLAQAVRSSRSQAMALGVARLSLSLAIESEDFEAATRDIEIVKSWQAVGEGTRLLLLLEETRLALAGGCSTQAEKALSALEELKQRRGGSRNTVAAVEERILVEIHARRFAGLERSIESHLEQAQAVGDVALSLALCLWLARVQMESLQSAQGLGQGPEHGAAQRAVLSSKRALAFVQGRDLGKPKVRCLLMMVASLLAAGRAAEAIPYYESLRDVVQSSHLLVHRLGTEAIGRFVLRTPHAAVAQSVAQVCASGLTPYVRPLFHEYGLLERVHCVLSGSESSPVSMTFVELVEQVAVSACSYVFTDELTMVIAVIQGKRATKCCVTFASMSLIDQMLRWIFVDGIREFTSADVHRLAYPNISFNSQSHGGRVRVFLARLKKVMAENAIPAEIVWSPAKRAGDGDGSGHYEVRFMRPVIQVSPIPG